MSNLDLDKKYVSFIVETVNKVLSDVDIFIYGSRMQGKSRDYSDVDIALKQKEKIPFEKLLLLKGLFENSTFPYKVDIVDLNSLSEEFLNIIECDLYKINT